MGLNNVFHGGESNEIDTLIVGSYSPYGEYQGAPDLSTSTIINIEKLKLLPTYTADYLEREEFYHYRHDPSEISKYSKYGSRFTIDQLNNFTSISGIQDIEWNNNIHATKASLIEIEKSYSEYSEPIEQSMNEFPYTSWRWLQVSGNGTLDLSTDKWSNDIKYLLRGDVDDQILKGTDNQDWFAAGEGNDIIQGNRGDDTLLGEEGNDFIEGGYGNDRLEGQKGIDTLHGGDGDDLLIGGGSNNKVFGQEGNDTVELNWGSVDNTSYKYDDNTNVYYYWIIFR